APLNFEIAVDEVAGVLDVAQRQTWADDGIADDMKPGRTSGPGRRGLIHIFCWHVLGTPEFFILSQRFPALHTLRQTRRWPTSKAPRPSPSGHPPEETSTSYR